MKKAVFRSIMALVMVLGLTLAMATPVLAGEVRVGKSFEALDPDDQDEPFRVGHTILFVMNVTNPSDNTATNTLTRIWDTMPDGTVIEYLAPDETLTQTPGTYHVFTEEYTVDKDDLVWRSGLQRWVVINQFEVEGIDSDDDELEGFVEKSVWVILDDDDPRPVGGSGHLVSRLALLVPWIVLAGLMAGATVFFWSRRAHGRA